MCSCFLTNLLTDIILKEYSHWGWNGGKGLGAIVSGLVLAPVASGIIAASIFTFIRVVVLVRKNPVQWAVFTSPFFFFLAGSVCTLYIVFKGSPQLGLDQGSGKFIVGWTLGVGGIFAVISIIFFLPFLHAKIIKKDNTLRWWEFVKGPLLWNRQVAANGEQANVPNYAVVQEDEQQEQPELSSDISPETSNSALPKNEQERKDDPSMAANELTYKELMAQGEVKFHAKLMKKRGLLGWSMRTLRDNPLGAGEIYELHNIKILVQRIPAIIVRFALYSLNYDSMYIISLIRLEAHFSLLPHSPL
jgi:sodium-dependent phosphate transporter